MFAGGLQQMSSSFDTIAANARIRLSRVRFEVIDFFRRPGFDPHH
jgi:hypothetical protein